MKAQSVPRRRKRLNIDDNEDEHHPLTKKKKLRMRFRDMSVKKYCKFTILTSDNRNSLAIVRVYLYFEHEYV